MKKTLKEIKQIAKIELNFPGINGFGLGDNTLRVYVVNDDIARKVPRVFYGIPVEVIIVGDASVDG